MMSNYVAHIIQWVLALTLAIAVITDIRSQKVYNWLTFPVFALGFILNCLRAGPYGLLDSLEGVCAGSIALVLVILGGMGAGDIKLIWAIGALMGPHFTVSTVLWTCISGGVIGVGYAIKKGELAHTIKNALIGTHVLALTKSPESLKGLAAASKVGKMPYAPAIAVGAAVATYLMSRQSLW